MAEMTVTVLSPARFQGLPKGEKHMDQGSGSQAQGLPLHSQACYQPRQASYRGWLEPADRMLASLDTEASRSARAASEGAAEVASCSLS